jgi:hypothetical protein
MSEHDAIQLEQAHLQEALLHSKAEARNSDGVTIVRLTFHSPQVKQHLISSEALGHLVTRVREAGCKVSPGWAQGALLLVPMTEEQAMEAELVLSAHNIVLLSSDVQLVGKVLKEMPRRSRHGAEVRPEHNADKSTAEMVSPDRSNFGSQSDPARSSPSSSRNGSFESVLVVERTFLSFPLRQFELSESSDVVKSAPADPASIREHTNPRRWNIDRNV